MKPPRTDQRTDRGTPVRVFVAIELNSEIRQRLAALSLELKRSGLAGRFVKPDSVHLTLRFLGNIGSSQIVPIGQALEAACGALDRFGVRFRGLGAFPGSARPRIVWVGLEESAPLTQLHRRIEDALEECGCEPERRKYKPHLTLVRLKAPPRQPDFSHLVRDSEDLDLGRLTVREVCLFESRLRPSGAEYLKLETGKLKMKDGSK